MSKFKRFATKDKLVEDFDWSDNDAVIRMFRDRIVGWYFEPIEEWPRTGHEAFVALLAVRQVIVTSAAALYEERSGEIDWVSILTEVDPEFARVGELPGTFAERFARAVLSVHDGELRMPDNEGISGTGRIATETEDGVLVFDPWVIRDRVRHWFEQRCEELAGLPYSDPSERVCRRLREAFTGGGENGDA